MHDKLNINLEPESIAQHFIGLNRAITWAATPDEWVPALDVMDTFLDQLDILIKSDEFERWSHQQKALIFGILMTIMAEVGQYRFEAFVPDITKQRDIARRKLIDQEFFPVMGKLRQHALQVTKTYLSHPIFDPISKFIQDEILHLLDEMSLESAPDRFMPFRVVQVANIIERIYGFSFRTDDMNLVGDAENPGLLSCIFQFKYLRFGTSGVRGRWQRDFTETRAKQVVQAICEYLNDEDNPAYLKAEKHSGKTMVIGYDSRLNARKVAGWAAQVCLANGFRVELSNRDTPTPALVYHLTDYLKPNEVAGLINCTASHNPPEWQGIKFNPRQGWPAPTSITDFIASRINEIQLLSKDIPAMDLDEAEASGKLTGFDPIDHYIKWVLDSGNGNDRVSIDPERIRKHYAGRKVVVDEMHGVGRGYLTRLLGEIGVQYTVIHAERDPHLPGLEYANPEEPFINPLKEFVGENEYVLGVAMDTDGDRFGVVDHDGVYYRPNQILPMLVRYLGLDRGIKGRVIATQTGSPLLEVIARKMEENDEFKPGSDVIPAYVDHPFYRRRLGQREDRIYEHTFMVPVGIKYIEEQRRTSKNYRMLTPLPDNWRDVILIGGEESSGLTTKGHVTDKDGIWANLLIMDMLAYYGARWNKPLSTIKELWEETCSIPGCWLTYGGREHEGSNSGRTDADSVLEVKENLINYFLDAYVEGQKNVLADLEVIYAGGVRYDLVELQLRDKEGDDRHFLRIRASGTEPINRFYVESSQSEIARKLMKAVVDKLTEITISHAKSVESEWRLADMLTYTAFKPSVLEAVQETLQKTDNWSTDSLASKLKIIVGVDGYLEGRNMRMAERWIDELVS